MVVAFVARSIVIGSFHIFVVVVVVASLDTAPSNIVQDGTGEHQDAGRRHPRNHSNIVVVVVTVAAIARGGRAAIPRNCRGYGWNGGRFSYGTRRW